MSFDFNDLLRDMRGAGSRLVTFDGGKRRERRFAEVRLDVLRAMAFLRGRGVRAGHRVGILAHNTYEWVVFDLACLGVGAVVVAFDATHDHDLAAECKRHGLVLLLHGPQWHGADGWPAVELHEALRLAPEVADESQVVHRHEAGAVIAVKFTSGSTGDSKCMEVRRESAEDSIGSVQAMFAHGPGDRILVFLPLHLIQQRYWIYSAIAYGADAVLCAHAFALTVMRSESPTVVMGIPGFFETLEKTYRTGVPLPEQGPASFQDYIGGKVRYLWTGSAGIPRGTLEFFEAMRVPMYQGYGTNETCIVSKNHPGMNRLGSVGPLLPHRELRFDDAGQVLVRPRHAVADRYLFQPLQDSRRVFLEDGFVATGDLGRLDADGFLHITGRLKDVVVLSSGRKFNPSHVEQTLKTDPDVLHCHVHGSERPYAVALICLRPGSGGRERAAALVAAANERLRPEERILGFELLDEEFSVGNGLLNAQLKPRRNQIQERYADRLAALYATHNCP